MVRRTACYGMLLIALLTPSAAFSAEPTTFSTEDLEFFEKAVRPILVARCNECHAGSGEPKGGLRLDSRESILKGGDTGPAFNKTQPRASLFLSAINYGDLYQMPPRSKLPPHEIQILTQWFEKGLPWPKETESTSTMVKPFDLRERAREHWCWQPLKETAPPQVRQTSWPLTDVDRFILHRLEEKELQPADTTDRRTLLRRIYFDLIGLPPTVGEINSFLADSDPLAYERVVDRLLNSVHFGERWARHWMDVVRYAETRGHEFEPIIPNAWQYRDYLIRAFNSDVPYDRFVMEQVAGDLVEPRWRTPGDDSSVNESNIGTGFWFLGEEVHSPVDIRKDETDRLDNRIDVLSKSFLGLTVACARCHDHKFDAISQRDYYALAGYALSGNYRQIRIDTFQQHQLIAEQLEQLRQRERNSLTEKLTRQIQPTLKKLDRYWSVAMDLIRHEQSISAAGTTNQPAPVNINQIASQRAKVDELDSILLVRWYEELNSARSDQSHVLHRLTQSVGLNREPLLNSEKPSDSEGDGLIVDFGNSTDGQTYQNGVSFGLTPTRAGSIELTGTAESPSFAVNVIGGWQRDAFWNGIKLTPNTEVDNGLLGKWESYGKMVRTPEFTLNSPQMWYLVRGSIRAYACVNSHLIIVGPLHNSLLREYRHSDNDWHWVSHGMELYQGHRLHVEFSGIDDLPCTIAQVYQGARPPAQNRETSPTLAEKANLATSQQEIQFAHHQWLASGLSLLNEALNGSRSQTISTDAANAADWLIRHQNLFSTLTPQTPSQDYYDAVKSLSKQVRWDSALAPSMMDANGVDEYLLVRGNSANPKDVVPRRFLEACQKSDDAIEVGGGRRDLAQSILQTPLAPRVAVNRVWHHLFGSGLVPTVDNFGVLGLPPTHPELLDYLAIRFQKENWSIKSLIRSLVLSRSYQMSSHSTAADAIDPKNELLHRMPVKRLEGEIIRDSLLAISGRLDSTSFGPSIPIHLTEFMQGRGRPGVSGPLDGNGRRSIYISVRRNFLSPMMLAFDTPNPFSTVGRRTVSNVPAQALILMNDPFVIQQATHWVERLMKSPEQTAEQRLDEIYLMAFARQPTPEEISDAKAFLAAQPHETKESTKEAWINLCHVVLNLKEFIFVE